MGVVVHLHDPFDATKRDVHVLAKPTTVRRLVQKHKGLRRHTSVRRPGGIYGRRRVREFTRPTVCLFNGTALTRAEWKRATVGAGDVVTFWAPPAGGGDGSNVLAVVAVVAVMIVAVVFQQYYAIPYLTSVGMSAAGAAAVSGAGVAIAVAAASYGIMALFAQPPPQAQAAVGFGSDLQNSPTYNLAIQGNNARLEQPIPEIFGRHRIFPDFIGQPYIRYIDNEQFIHMGLGIGIGEYSIETDSIKVGDTPITVFDEIEHAVVEPNGTHDVDIWDTRWLPSQDISTVDLPGDEATPTPSPWQGPFACNPPRTLISRFEFDLTAPRGLMHK